MEKYISKPGKIAIRAGVRCCLIFLFFETHVC